MKALTTTTLSMGLLSLAIMNSIALAADDPATSTDSDNSSNSSVQIGGFIRSETAINTDSANPYNQKGNIFNGVAISRSSPVVPPLYTDTVVRNGGSDDHRLDMQAFRGQLDVTAHFSDDFSGVAKLRAIYDPGWYDEYSPSAVGSHAVGAVYHDPNYFKYSVQGLARPNPLEWAGRNYMIDFPALFMEYNHGPLDVRLGNQQIAWGQALFFRVLDVPDGLDLRRHSVLDYVPEEYSDKRVPALAARISYQFDNAWLVDGYVQKFQPSILGNPNTPYNIIPAQFTVHDLYGQYNDKVDFGLRAKGSVGDFGVQAIYAQRYNPDGVYRWTQSGVNRDIPGIPGSGQALQCSPFEVDSTGVWSSNEWFNYAAASRLNGVGGLNAAINDFPCSQALGAVPVPNYTYASYELNQFFQLAGGLLTGNAAGGLRGHIARDYKKEDDIGGGLSYTFSGAPGSITDQLIMNWEVLYVPNRTFTAPDLNINYLRTNEWTTALVLEKYQRFSDSLPATYIVAQFLYKSKSDLFGRYIGDQDGGGYGGNQFKNATGYGGGFKALAFAIQQPFPNLIWRFDLAVLYDLQGGVLIQPAVRWKPNGKVTAELFYNYINSHIGGNPYGNMFGGLDYAKELTLRVGYQF